MSSDDDIPEPAPVSAIEPGRQIELVPLPPGAAMVGLGVLLAGLAPLGGFLGGSMAGPGDSSQRIGPLFLFLFAGFVLGALGIILAGFGGRRLYQHLRAVRD